ncbi:Putative protein methyltransferase involved in meiosis and transcriptional silencing (Dot1) [Phaffia rhodozyma]|uniref:Histone-lysine N-methyltransferase, H3 lysine-79 specific n=1 Tax=Phaffia rhodozyma TaxID=264483 RepID=A0A0F7SP37_PHARH|nr:Putative protein methyltransferase involved in meiosis and transcriptional silencing (Dot1) [Phaffia rhodozyma]
MDFFNRKPGQSTVQRQRQPSGVTIKKVTHTVTVSKPNPVPLPKRIASSSSSKSQNSKLSVTSPHRKRKQVSTSTSNSHSASSSASTSTLTPSSAKRPKPNRPSSSSRRRSSSTSSSSSDPESSSSLSSESEDGIDPSTLFDDRARSGTPLDASGPIGEYIVDRSVVAKPEKKSWKSWDGFIHSADMMELERIGYVPFFNSTEKRKEAVSVKIDYPSGASERFLLLQPKSAVGEYHPVPEICRVIKIVLEHFASPLGSEPTPSSPPLTASLPLAPLGSPSTTEPISLNTPLPLPRSLVPSNPTTPAVSSPFNPNSTGSSPLPAAHPTPSQIIRAITRSIAPNVLSLPMFLQAVEQYNNLIRYLRQKGEIGKAIEGMRGLNGDVWGMICEQGYQRVVGPRMEKLKDYVPFSSNTYGELNSTFLSYLLRQTGLTPRSTFVDLGSGVGNCVFQTALQVGCESFGCEQLDGPAGLAKDQLAEFKRRAGMWGVKPGRVKLWHGDFCELKEVGEVLKRADLLVCNNYAFSSILNDRLSLLFLDLKEGAKIVSLKPFVNPDFRLTERNCSSPQAILQLQEFRFPRHSVSWTDEGGRYYIQTVNRSRLIQYLS